MELPGKSSTTNSKILDYSAIGGTGGSDFPDGNLTEGLR